MAERLFCWWRLRCARRWAARHRPVGAQQGDRTRPADGRPSAAA
ncbi:hypothetical protein [Blastococcus sp. VKM Ac-2987]|nr:hypothetical protein [Blastococcus sp. VKM Ac-2987]MCZ2860185.1 hypothetical protein [Blastococcus sp. VKM Ac-2987]